MLFDDDKVTEAAQFQRQRCAAFGARTAERIREARDCQFSLLPYDELTRLASGWYDASARAMLNGDYTAIDTWTRAQARVAAEQNFGLEDLLGILKICRSAAIQEEKWNEDIFSVVDEVINEGLHSIRSEVAWSIPNTLDYLSWKVPDPAAQSRASQPATTSTAVLEPQECAPPPSGNSTGNRRDFTRNRLRLPIRVRTAAAGAINELTYSENVSRSGLYFFTRTSSYKLQTAVKVTYPYWSEPGSINREYSATVVRLDPMTDGTMGIAVEFTESLGPGS
jgi:hypothetical protein